MATAVSATGAVQRLAPRVGMKPARRVSVGIRLGVPSLAWNASFPRVCLANRSAVHALPLTTPISWWCFHFRPRACAIEEASGSSWLGAPRAVERRILVLCDVDGPVSGRCGFEGIPGSLPSPGVRTIEVLECHLIHTPSRRSRLSPGWEIRVVELPCRRESALAFLGAQVLPASERRRRAFPCLGRVFRLPDASHSTTPLDSVLGIRVLPHAQPKRSLRYVLCCPGCGGVGRRAQGPPVPPQRPRAPHVREHDELPLGQAPPRVRRQPQQPDQGH